MYRWRFAAQDEHEISKWDTTWLNVSHCLTVSLSRCGSLSFSASTLVALTSGPEWRWQWWGLDWVQCHRHLVCICWSSLAALQSQRLGVAYVLGLSDTWIAMISVAQRPMAFSLQLFTTFASVKRFECKSNLSYGHIWYSNWLGMSSPLSKQYVPHVWLRWLQRWPTHHSPDCSLMSDSDRWLLIAGHC